MKLRIFAAVLLLAVIAGAVWGAWVLQKEYALTQKETTIRTQQLQTLQDKTAALQQTLDGLTLDAAQARQEEADRLTRETEELAAQLALLQTEMETMKTYLEENQDAAAEAQEELTYLQGVYDELEKGLAQVEGYLAGN